jgi:transposase InsO family protein
MSERHACLVVKQPRGTQRYRPTQREDEDALTQAIVTLASQYGRYGYRRITALLRHAGWHVGKDRVERIWRREGLKVPQKQKPRGKRGFLAVLPIIAVYGCVHDCGCGHDLYERLCYFFDRELFTGAGALTSSVKMSLVKASATARSSR